MIRVLTAVLIALGAVCFAADCPDEAGLIYGAGIILVVALLVTPNTPHGGRPA